MQKQPLQRCDNCLKQFPQSKIATHFGYCRRNIKKCPTCNELFDINFKQEHDQQYHKQETCPHCSRSFPSCDYKTHLNNCNLKPKHCQYCDLNVPVDKYPTHLKECESRTKPCLKCNVAITNKDFYIHQVSCQGPREEIKQPSRNYQEHVQKQQRRLYQQQMNEARINSRQKPIPSYQSKIRQEKPYVPKTVTNVVENKRPPEPKYVSYIPPPRQEYVSNEHRNVNKYQNPPPRVQPKREQIKRYPNPIIAPPPPSNLPKRQQIRQPPKVISQQRVIFNGQPANQKSSSREVSMQNQIPNEKIVSNKNIFPTQNNSYKGITVKQSKSIERINAGVRKQDRPPNNYHLPQNDYKVPASNFQRIKAPETKARVIYTSQVPYQPEGDNHLYNNDVYQQYPNQSMGFGVEEDHEMQMAIMQSLGQNGCKNSQQDKSYSFQMDNLSLIEQQRAIEEDLKKKRRR